MKIAVTGSIGSGKTTVATLLHERLKFPLFIADRVAHECMMPGRPAYDKVVNEFGKVVLGEDGCIDRRKLGAIVFADKASMDRLNELVHPYVRQECVKFVTGNEAAGRGSVLDIPLLFESGFEGLADKVVVVAVREDVRCQRLKTRSGLSEAEVEKCLSFQMSQERKIELADFTIRNNGSREELRLAVHELADSILSRKFDSKIYGND